MGRSFRPRFRLPWRAPGASMGLGRPALGPSQWWTQPTSEDTNKTCFRSKTAALKAFIEANRNVIDTYGGLDYQVGPSEFDAVNHKYGTKVRTIADALWTAMPSGRPFCLDRIDLEALNDTSPARQSGGGAFVLPDRVLEEAIAKEEAAYYQAIQDEPVEVAPSSEPVFEPWEAVDDPAAQAYADTADERERAYIDAARDARRRPRKRTKPAPKRAEPKPRKPPEPIVELAWERKPRRRSKPAVETPVRRTLPRKPRRKLMSKRIDDSHQPFKRTRKIGPGPKRHPPVLQVKEWECRKGKKKYEQICVYVGPNKERRGTVTKNRMNPRKKKKYNKLYRKWAAKNRKALTARGPRPGYKCRRTRNTKCR